MSKVVQCAIGIVVNILFWSTMAGAVILWIVEVSRLIKERRR